MGALPQERISWAKRALNKVSGTVLADKFPAVAARTERCRQRVQRAKDLSWLRPAAAPCALERSRRAAPRQAQIVSLAVWVRRCQHGRRCVGRIGDEGVRLVGTSFAVCAGRTEQTAGIVAARGRAAQGGAAKIRKSSAQGLRAVNPGASFQQVRREAGPWR